MTVVHSCAALTSARDAIVPVHRFPSFDGYLRVPLNCPREVSLDEDEGAAILKTARRATTQILLLIITLKGFTAGG